MSNPHDSKMSHAKHKITFLAQKMAILDEKSLRTRQITTAGKLCDAITHNFLSYGGF